MGNTKQDGPGRPCDHGAYYIIRTGELPKRLSERGRAALQKVIEETEDALVDDLGGPESVSMAQMVVVKDVVQCTRIIEAITAYSRQHDVYDVPTCQNRGRFRLHPIYERIYIQYVRLRKDLLAGLFPAGLGHRVTDEGPSLHDIKAQIIGQREEKENAAERS